MNYVFTGQLHLRKGVRDMYFDWVSCRNGSFKQCLWKEKLTAKEEKRSLNSAVDNRTPFIGLAVLYLQKGSVLTKQSFWSERWKQRNRASWQPFAVPCNCLMSLSQWRGKLFNQVEDVFMSNWCTYIVCIQKDIWGRFCFRLKWAVYLNCLYS